MEGTQPVSAKPVLVLGGGVAGQRAALDLAHAGAKVLLVERSTTLGGTVAQLGTMFPLHNCLLCRGTAQHGPGCTRPTIAAELLDRSCPPHLQVWTRSRLIALSGQPGDLVASIRREPRYVDPARCTSCGRCAEACPQILSDPFQAGLAERRAAYRPAERAVPDAYAIDRGEYCLACGRCAAACPTQAIDLDEAPRDEEVPVSAAVLATGIELYDAALSGEYGYGRYANVFTGLEMERMASPAGPGEGRVRRRSDGRPPARIAWLQCVGSREEGRDYCSAFCCGYATRQAVLARQLLPQAEAHIHLMDDRVFAQSFSSTYDPLRAAYGIRLWRHRPSVLREDPQTRDLILQVTDGQGRVVEERYQMVVLSVGGGAAREAHELAAALGLQPDAHGFIRTPGLAPGDSPRPGIFVAGAAAGPADIADSASLASAAAARVRAFLGYTPQSRTAPSREAPPAGPPRIGVLICDCAGEIGGVIDLPAVLAYAHSLPGIATAQAIPFGCLPEGLDALRHTVATEDLTGLVVGACKRRTFGPLFARELPVPVQFADLREECAAVHRDDPAGATRKAAELVRVAVDRAGRTPSAPIPAIRPERAALVIGGGLAGLTAALHLADGGAPVHLVEQEAGLGGQALRVGRTLEGEDLAAHVRELGARVLGHPRITCHTSAGVVRHSGRLGQFTATLRRASGQIEDVQVGATVIATGGEEYRGLAYGLGGSARVLTLLDLERRLAEAPGLPAQLGQVAFIGCVGPWDEPGSSQAWRCSRTCCAGMIRQALAIKAANPACQVAVLSREINTYGLAEEHYTTARRAGVLFVRHDPSTPPTIEDAPPDLRLVVHDASLGEVLELHPDLVALGAAILPRAGTVPIERSRAFSKLGSTVPQGRSRALLELGSPAPQGPEGFIRSWEGKTRPFATLEPGVYLCGLAQGPKPSREALAQALAAADQALTLLSQERLEPGGTVAAVEKKLCAGCLTCVRTCPYGVPRVEVERAGQARIKPVSFVDPFRCQGCGVCAGECPVQAIALSQYSDEELLGDRLLGRWLAMNGE